MRNLFRYGGVPQSLRPQNGSGWHTVRVDLLQVPVAMPSQRDLGVLTRDEHERAERIQDAHARVTFLAARVALRLALADRTGVEPCDLEISLTEQGKPYLVRGSEFGIDFNLSHCDDLIVIVITDGAAVGVDVEAVKPLQDIAGMAAGIMTDREKLAFDELPEVSKPSAFLRVWTRKEAVLKAAGAGFTIEPRTVHVGSDDAEEGTALLDRAPGQYRFCDIDVGERHKVALSVAGVSQIVVNHVRRNLHTGNAGYGAQPLQQIPPLTSTGTKPHVQTALS